MSQKKELPSSYKIISYSTPKLHEGKKWYVDFFQVDPSTQEVRRKKYHVDSEGTVKQKRKRANDLIACLTERLRSGWNVWANIEQSREYTLANDVFDYYIRYVQRMVKTSIMTEKSGRTYISFMNNFREWIENRAEKVVYCYQLNSTVIEDFLDYILIDREGSARTRNNYRGWLVTYFSWMIDKGYHHENPADRIKHLREEPKQRDALHPKDLEKLSEYLRKENKYYLLACMMEYYTFIRPGELSCIKLEHFHLKEQKIFVSATISKNRRDGMVALNDTLINLMIELDIFKNPGEYYLFGKDFRPSAKKADSRIFREYFVKVRAKLKWKENYQFYSLKDSGIRDLANAEGIVVARDQARHTDVATTNMYLKGQDMSVNEKTKHFKGSL